MITVSSALKGELQPLFEYFKIKNKINIEGGSLYIVNDKLHLLRCGVGGARCLKSLSAYFKAYATDGLINIGTAGIIRQGIEPGEIFSIVKIYGRKNKKKYELQDDGDFYKASLLSVDEPLTDIELRNEYFGRYGIDLVDMEAWYCAQLADEHKIKFISWKIASDYADSNTQEDFLKNYKWLTQKLARNIIPMLSKRLVK